MEVKGLLLFFPPSRVFCWSISAEIGFIGVALNKALKRSPENSNYGNYDHKRKCLKLWQHKAKYVNFSSFILGLNYTLTQLEVLLKRVGGGGVGW